MKSLNHNHEDLFDLMHLRRGGAPRAAPGDPSEAEGAQTGIMEVLPAALMAIVNYLVFSLALMLLARYVVDQKLFGVYSAAVAAITVAATAATLGMEKYLLKIVPKYRAEHRMPLVRGFRRFAPLVVVVVTVLVMGVLLLVHRLSPPSSALSTPTFLLAIWFLPAVVLVCWLVEVVTTDGAFVASIALYRIVLPTLFLLGVLGLGYHYGSRHVTASQGVLVWSLSWTVVLLLLYAVSRSVRPRNVGAGDCSFKRIQWLRHSTSYLTFSLLMSLVTNLGVLVLGFIPDARQDTAIFAAAAQLAGLIVVISTATSRWYGPRLSACLALGDAAGQSAFLRSRQLMMGAFALGFMAFLWFGGEWALGLFGPKYRAGWTALVIMGVGSSFNCLHSLSPLYLLYEGRERVVPLMLGGAVVLLLGSAIPLGLLVGTTGVAIAYSGTLVLVYGVFTLFARRDRRRMLAKQGRGDQFTWL
ncbi:MAG: hypothetical protein VXY94_00365 [Planctomycetota bacterium]|nr:hypothetical protein [Planctomycetota bacterium]